MSLLRQPLVQVLQLSHFSFSRIVRCVHPVNFLKGFLNLFTPRSPLESPIVPPAIPPPDYVNLLVLNFPFMRFVYFFHVSSVPIIFSVSFTPLSDHDEKSVPKMKGFFRNSDLILLIRCCEIRHFLA